MICLYRKLKKKKKSCLAAVLVAGICLRAQPYVKNSNALESKCKGEVNRFVDEQRAGNNREKSVLWQVIT